MSVLYPAHLYTDQSFGRSVTLILRDSISLAGIFKISPSSAYVFMIKYFDYVFMISVFMIRV